MFRKRFDDVTFCVNRSFNARVPNPLCLRIILAYIGFLSLLHMVLFVFIRRDSTTVNI